MKIAALTSFLVSATVVMALDEDPCEAKHCGTWECEEWCACFNPELEADLTYESFGCGDDGNSECAVCPDVEDTQDADPIVSEVDSVVCGGEYDSEKECEADITSLLMTDVAGTAATVTCVENDALLSECTDVEDGSRRRLASGKAYEAKIVVEAMKGQTAAQLNADVAKCMKKPRTSKSGKKKKLKTKKGTKTKSSKKSAFLKNKSSSFKKKMTSSRSYSKIASVIKGWGSRFSKYSKKAKSAVSRAPSKAKPSFKKAVSSFGSKAKSAVSHVKSTASKLKSFMSKKRSPSSKSAASSAMSKVKTAASKARPSFKRAVSSVGSKAKSAVSHVKSAASKARPSFKRAVSSVGSKAKSAVSHVKSAASKAKSLSSIVKGFMSKGRSTSSSKSRRSIFG